MFWFLFPSHYRWFRKLKGGTWYCHEITEGQTNHYKTVTRGWSQFDGPGVVKTEEWS